MLTRVLCCLLLVVSASAGPREQFEEGLVRYRENDMAGAIEVWQQLADAGISSGELHYNLGNAYYRQGRIGKAIQNYERAHLLLPRDRDVLSNLELARLGTVDKIETPIRLILWNWVDAIRDFLSLRELALIIQIGGFAVSGMLIAWRLLPARWSMLFRRLVIYGAALYVLAAGWYVWRAVLDARAFGIIMATKTDAYSAPDQGSKQVFSLHEGTKVRLGETVRGTRPGETAMGWTHIRLADGRQGWISVSDVERI